MPLDPGGGNSTVTSVPVNPSEVGVDLAASKTSSPGVLLIFTSCHVRTCQLFISGALTPKSAESLPLNSDSELGTNWAQSGSDFGDVKSLKPSKCSHLSTPKS